MGQACSTKERKKQSKLGPISRRQVAESAPPPYADEWKRSNPSHSSDLGRKDFEPDIGLHPALRNVPNSSETEIRAPRIPSQKVKVKRPAPSHHRRNVSFLDISPSPSLSTIPRLPTYTSSIIDANSVPQWRWTNSQCRTWLTDVLVTYGGRGAQPAKELAEAFKGFGPNLYMKEWKQWNSWLGADGQAIFALLLEVHDQEGAVPKEVEIAHYRKEGIAGWGEVVNEDDREHKIEKAGQAMTSNVTEVAC